MCGGVAAAGIPTETWMPKCKTALQQGHKNDPLWYVVMAETQGAAAAMVLEPRWLRVAIILVAAEIKVEVEMQS